MVAVMVDYMNIEAVHVAVEFQFVHYIYGQDCLNFQICPISGNDCMKMFYMIFR